MPVKNIKLNQKYQTNIESRKKEQDITNEIVSNLYNRFMNEANANNLEYALGALEDYRYVPYGYCIPTGRYIRYIDNKDANDMKLKLGGFVLYDNKYSVTFKSSNSHIVKLNKRHCVMFVSITYNELMRLNMEKIINS